MACLMPHGGLFWIDEWFRTTWFVFDFSLGLLDFHALICAPGFTGAA